MEEKKELLDQDEIVVEIELERLRGFVNHPFKVQADSQMIELQESIKKYGILNPLIVRPRQDGTYEIISGHRRKFEAEKMLKNIKFLFAEDVDKHDFIVVCSSFYILRPQIINLVKVRLNYLLLSK